MNVMRETCLTSSLKIRLLVQDGQNFTVCVHKQVLVRVSSREDWNFAVCLWKNNRTLEVEPFFFYLGRRKQIVDQK